MSPASRRLGAPVLALALLGAACPRDKQTGGGAGSDPSCEEARPRVEKIYEREKEPVESEKERELAAEILRANVHMVLEDCKTAPARFVPCIEEAKSVEELERECLIPLDDEGKVEGRRFGGE